MSKTTETLSDYDNELLTQMIVESSDVHSFLNRVSTVLTSTSSPILSVLTCIISEVNNTLEIESSCEKDNESISIVKSYNLTELSNIDSALADCMRYKRPSLTYNSNLHPIFKKYLSVESKHICYYPIMHSDSIVGIILLGSSKISFFNGKFMDYLRNVTNTIAAGLTKMFIQEHMNNAMRKLKSLNSRLSDLGPQVTTNDVTNTVLDIGRFVLNTELIALYTIDPRIGGIDSQHTSKVNNSLVKTYLAVCLQTMTDREQKDAWILTLASDNISSQLRNEMIDNGIELAIAAPIRSLVGASGTLVAFYKTQQALNQDLVYLVEAVADQASMAISYALAIEQSHFLLDDLAGINQELTLQASEDALTGLANHRSLQQTLSDLCRSSKNRDRRIFSMLMIDVDHFKSYNDTYGHLEGDTVLKKIARVILVETRHADLAARYGGEEFSIILRGIDKDGAILAAERLRAAIEEQTLGKRGITVSIGVAQYPIDGNTSGEIVERADRALYQAKATGRNKVIAFDSTTDEYINKDEYKQAS